MISVDDVVFNRTADVLRTEYGRNNIYVTRQYKHMPSGFPHVSVIEADNATHLPSLELTHEPVASNLMYEINVYSNSTDNKTQADGIMNIVDSEMQAMGFIRTFKNPISNLENATIYRIVARYIKTQTQGGIL